MRKQIISCITILLTISTIAFCNNEIMIIAHRGASGYAPENTLNGFKKAISLGVEAVEFDIHKSKTGDLIVIHDPSVDRTTNGTGLIKDKTLAEIKALSLKNGGTIPTFSEVLDALDAKAKIIIDIKEEGVADSLANNLHVYIEKGWRTDQFYATGFFHEELKKLKALAPFVKLIPTMIGTPHKLALSAKEMNAHGVCLINAAGLLSKTLANDIKAHGLELWVWSPCENSQALTILCQLKVDAIMVDYPDIVKELLIEIAIQEKLKTAAHKQR